MIQIFILLILFQLKHFLADFPLQTTYMLGKMNKENWVLPLLTHTLVHGILSLTIILSFAPYLWWLALIDMIIHFIMDRIKASPYILGKFKIEEPEFWWSLGFDQMIHHFTHYSIIACIVLI